MIEVWCKACNRLMVNNEENWVCINCETRIILKTSFAKNLKDFNKQNCDENGCKVESIK